VITTDNALFRDLVVNLRSASQSVELVRQLVLGAAPQSTERRENMRYYGICEETEVVIKNRRQVPRGEVSRTFAVDAFAEGAVPDGKRISVLILPFWEFGDRSSGFIIPNGRLYRAFF
jgi:hypothetical protein